MLTDRPITAKRRFFYSFRSQILAAFLLLFYLCLAGIALCSLFGIPYTRYVGMIEEAETKSFAQLNLVADLKKERLQQWLEERRSDIKLLAKNKLLSPLLVTLYQETSDPAAPTTQAKSAYQQLSLYLREMQNDKNFYEKISIVEKDTGRTLVSTNHRPLGASSYIETDERLFPPGSDEHIVLETGERGQLFLEIHRIVEVDGGPGKLRPKVVVSAKINTDAFIGPLLYTGRGVGKTGETLLVTQKRQLVTSLKHPLPDGSIARLLLDQISDSPSRFAAGGQEGVISTTDYRGIPVLAAYRHIQLTTELHWGMVVKIDKDEVHQTLQKNIVTLLAMICAAGLLVAFVSFFVTRRFSDALVEMVRVAERVEDGDLDVRVTEKTHDELGVLAFSLNKMIGQLQFWHDELESQVIKRTTDLQETTARLSQEIIAHKAAAEELRLQSEITNRMSEGVYLARMDGVIVYANPKFEEMFGYQQSEMIGKHASIINYPTEKPPEDTAREILAIIDSKGAWQGEIKNIKKDGSPFWCYASVVAFQHANYGKVLVAVHSDITQRKLTENALRESEEFRARVFNSSRLPIVVMDAVTFRYLDCNPAAIDIYRFPSREAVLGKTPIDFSAPVQYDGTPSPEKAQFYIEKALSEEEVVFEWLHQRPDGELWDAEVQLMSFQIGQQRLLQFTLDDITERKNSEKEKARLLAQLNQAHKMEAIGILAGGIAHDFNNILAAILGYAELARDDSEPGSQVYHDLDKVMLSTLRAKDLVKQILAFSRQAAVDRMPIKIQPLVKESLKMLRSSIPSTISITEEIDPQSATILADPTQIHQIIMNLCTNAYHAMEETGGELSVKVNTTDIDSSSAESRNIAPGEYVELTVSDTGAGIGRDIIGKIFDPYFTTKDVGKGTGMGLSITHGIIKNYGGAITVESTLNKGTTFHLYFPAIDKEEVREAKESKEAPRGNGRILYVDDEELLLEMGQIMMERLGYTVISRSSSIEALETFMEDPHQFDIVITDQTMPGMTGIDLARRMLQIRPDIPIILCTGYSNLVDEESVKAIGIREFAFKPLTKSSIGQLIQKVFERETEV